MVVPDIMSKFDFWFVIFVSFTGLHFDCYCSDITLFLSHLLSISESGWMLVLFSWYAWSGFWALYCSLFVHACWLLLVFSSWGVAYLNAESLVDRHKGIPGFFDNLLQIGKDGQILDKIGTSEACLLAYLSPQRWCWGCKCLMHGESEGGL